VEGALNDEEDSLSADMSTIAVPIREPSSHPKSGVGIDWENTKYRTPKSKIIPR
jgi:hypothetical protein